MDQTLPRATPEQWCNYSTSSLIIKVLKDNKPSFLCSTLKETLYSTRRKPLIDRFYKYAQGKIGKKPIQKRLGHMERLTQELDRKEMEQQPNKSSAQIDLFCKKN